jgi:hypothetical protein
VSSHDNEPVPKPGSHLSFTAPIRNFVHPVCVGL